MSTFYRAPEIRFLQSAGKLNGTLDPWSDSESDDESFTAKTPAEDETEAQEKMAEQEGKVQEKIFVRPYEEKHREAVADVCVQTASEGIQNLRSPNPAKEGEVEPELLVPHMWAYPYLTLSPDYCFVLLAEECEKEKVVGYILGTPDTNKFVDRINNEYVESQRTTRPWLSKDWVPPDKDADREVHVKWAGQEDAEKKARKLLAMLHYPGDSLISNRYPDLVSAYPAHLHINILPEFVGKGYGRQLQETLWARLREDGIPGVHLECGKENDNAIAFYGHLGFVPWDVVMDGGVSGKKGVFREKIAGGVASVSGLAMVKKL